MTCNKRNSLITHIIFLEEVEAKTLTCFFVKGNVATLTITVNKIIAKPYEYGT